MHYLARLLRQALAELDAAVASQALAAATEQQAEDWTEEEIDRAMKAMLGGHSGPYTASLRADFRRALKSLNAVRAPRHETGETK